MSMHSNRYYQSSGAIPFAATAMMLVAGFVVAAVVGLPVVFLPLFAESVLFAAFCSLVYGAIVGWSVRWVGRLAHVRHPGFARFVGLAAGAFAVYCGWVWFVWCVNGYDVQVLTDRIAHPEKLLLDVRDLAAVGVWSIFEFEPRGWQLLGFWIAEAVAIMTIAVVTSADETGTYCEDCGLWTRDAGLLIRFPCCPPDELRRTLEEEQYAILDELRQQSCDMKDRYDLKIAECPMCVGANYLTIEHMTVTKDDENNTVTTSRPIVTNLIVPRSLVEHLTLPVFDGNPALRSDPQPELQVVEVS